MTRIRASVASIAITCILLAAVPSQSAQYKLHVLDMPAGHRSAVGLKINDNGLVVGYSNNVSNPQYSDVYYWDSTGAHSAGFMLGYYKYAGVNDGGAIVGDQYVRSGATLSTRQALYPPFSANLFHDINSTDVVAGSSVYDSVGHQEAAYWDSAGIHPIAGTLWANAINDSGQIVGQMAGGGFLYAKGTLTSIGGFDTYASSDAQDINSTGQVVGAASSTGKVAKAYVWQNSHASDLLGWSDKNSAAYAINDSGQVVGAAWTILGANSAYVWDKGDVTMLQGLGGNTVAWGVNNSGWIVGESRGTDNKTYAVVWEPVPEPSAIVVLFAGLCATLAGAKRRLL